MPEVPIIMPQLGESIAEAKVVRINVNASDDVREDQEIIEVETSKATMGVPSLCGGKVIQIMAKEGESYAVGAVLGILEVTEEELERTGVSAMAAVDPLSENNQGASGASSGGENLHFQLSGDDYKEPSQLIEPSIQGLPVPAGTKGALYMSPRMKARMDELGLRGADISAIVGSGSGGRVTVEDLESFLEYIDQWPSSKASTMRMAVADAMRRSWTRPLATVGLSVPLDKLLDYRRQQNPKPGLTLYLLRAFAIALSENPESAGYLIGEKIVHPRAFDMGVAVQVEDGVLVPVIRGVDKKSVSDLSAEYTDLVDKSRNRRLTMEETQGGIATVTNFGTFGLGWGTPVPLPNETLILGVGAGIKKPRWSESVEAFLPVTEADLILTFDHRVVDGGGAGMLLNRVSELLQNPHLI